jgi:hypothetical protein
MATFSRNIAENRSRFCSRQSRTTSSTAADGGEHGCLAASIASTSCSAISIGGDLGARPLEGLGLREREIDVLAVVVEDAGEEHAGDAVTSRPGTTPCGVMRPTGVTIWTGSPRPTPSSLASSRPRRIGGRTARLGLGELGLGVGGEVGVWLGLAGRERGREAALGAQARDLDGGVLPAAAVVVFGRIVGAGRRDSGDG